MRYSISFNGITIIETNDLNKAKKIFALIKTVIELSKNNRLFCSLYDLQEIEVISEIF